MLPDQFWHDLGPVLGLILAVLMFVIVITRVGSRRGVTYKRRLGVALQTGCGTGTKGGSCVG